MKRITGAAMPGRAAHLAIAFVLSFASCAGAQELSYKSGLKGAAASAVGKYIESTQVECDRTGKGNETCALGPIAVWSKPARFTELRRIAEPCGAQRLSMQQRQKLPIFAEAAVTMPEATGSDG